jgi:hypothetical protein
MMTKPSIQALNPGSYAVLVAAPKNREFCQWYRGNDCHVKAVKQDYGWVASDPTKKAIYLLEVTKPCSLSEAIGFVKSTGPTLGAVGGPDSPGGRAEDLDAINKYIMSTETKTEAGKKAKDEWVHWFQALGWGEKNMWNTDTLNVARNKRLDFNRANAVTEKEKQAIETVTQTGLSKEQQYGGVSAQDSSGKYHEEPPFSLLGDSVGSRIAQVGIALLVALGLGAYITKKL